MITLEQSSKITMYQTITDTIKLYLVLFTGIPGFKVRFEAFTANLLLLFKQSQEKEHVITATPQLKKLRKQLIDAAHSISSKALAYGVNVKNELIISENKISKRALNNSTHQNLVTKCELIYTRAFALKTELLVYLVTEDMFTLFRELIDEFRASIPAPRENKNQISETIKTMDQLFKANNQLLLEMDQLAEILIESQPATYRAYKAARKVVKTAKRIKSVTGKITELGTNLPLKGVTIAFYANGQELKAAENSNIKPIVVKKSAKKGGFIDSTLTDGSYLAKVMRTGYKPQSITVVIRSGETTRLMVEMEKE